MFPYMNDHIHWLTCGFLEFQGTASSMEAGTVSVLLSTGPGTQCSAVVH